MKKERRICKNYEFSSIIQNRNFFKSSAFVLYYEPRKLDHARVGISVGKKLGNAVQRNLVKRQVRSMVDSLFDFSEDYDVILIVRPFFAQKSYQENIDDLKKVKNRVDQKYKRKGTL